MANHWFRVYAEFAHDPKVQMMSEPMQRRYIMLMCMRCSNDLVTLHDDEVAFHLRISADDWAATKTTFIAKGFIDEQLNLLNWEKRQFKTDSSTSSAERVAKHRAKKRQAESNAVTGDETLQVTPDNGLDTDTDTDTEKKYQEPNGSVGGADSNPDPKAGKGQTPDLPAKPGLPNCNAQAVVDAYHTVLPELPKVRLMNDARRKAIRKLWQWVLTSKKTDNTPRAETAEQALEWIRGYFTRARDNDFLMGRGMRSGEHANWQCDLDFLLTDKGMKHVIEKTRTAA